jgi:hypothetical protein
MYPLQLHYHQRTHTSLIEEHQRSINIKISHSINPDTKQKQNGEESELVLS